MSEEQEMNEELPRGVSLCEKQPVDDFEVEAVPGSVISCPMCSYMNTVGDMTEGTTYKCCNCDATITVD